MPKFSAVESLLTVAGLKLMARTLRRAIFRSSSVGVKKNRKGTLLLLTALVLLAGDIHPDPGSSSPAVASCEFLCTICGQCVGEDPAAICCDNCKRWTHIWCGGGVSLEEYNRMVDNTDHSPWFYPACIASEFPYHQTSAVQTPRLALKFHPLAGIIPLQCHAYA